MPISRHTPTYDEERNLFHLLRSMGCESPCAIALIFANSLRKCFQIFNDKVLEVYSWIRYYNYYNVNM